MMRRSPMKRTAWPSRSVPSVKEQEKTAVIEAPRVRTAPKKIAPALRRPVVMDVIAPQDCAVPKTVPQRNRALLDLARDMPCLLQVPKVCNGRTDTTVACHSNAGTDGKAGARKADDQHSAWGCVACHGWLDQGRAPRGEKDAVFLAAHHRQVLAWRQIVADPRRSRRDRDAVQWALDRLGATPVSAMFMEMMEGSEG